MSVATANAGVILVDLSPADSPDVLQYNHSYNLKLLSQEHQKRVEDIEQRRDDAIRACAADSCVAAVRSAVKHDLELELQRYGVAVDEENLNFDRALKGANTRLQQEADARRKELQAQHRRQQQERARIDAARDEERKQAIVRSEGHADTLGLDLAQGDQAVAPVIAGSYGDVAARFRPKRRDYISRQPAAPASASSKSAATAPRGGGSATTCEGEQASSRPCREQALVVEIRRLEALRQSGANIARLDERIGALKQALMRLRTSGVPGDRPAVLGGGAP